MLLNYSYKTAGNYTPQQYAVVVNGTKESSLDIIVENADRLEKKVKDFLLIHRLDFLKKTNYLLEPYTSHAYTP